MKRFPIPVLLPVLTLAILLCETSASQAYGLFHSWGASRPAYSAYYAPTYSAGYVPSYYSAGYAPNYYSAGYLPSTSFYSTGYAPSTSFYSAGYAPSTSFYSAGYAPSTSYYSAGYVPSTSFYSAGYVPSTSSYSAGYLPSTSSYSAGYGSSTSYYAAPAADSACCDAGLQTSLSVPSACCSPSNACVPCGNNCCPDGGAGGCDLAGSQNYDSNTDSNPTPVTPRSEGSGGRTPTFIDEEDPATGSEYDNTPPASGTGDGFSPRTAPPADPLDQDFGAPRAGGRDALRFRIPEIVLNRREPAPTHQQAVAKNPADPVLNLDEKITSRSTSQRTRLIERRSWERPALAKNVTRQAPVENLGWVPVPAPTQLVQK